MIPVKSNDISKRIKGVELLNYVLFQIKRNEPLLMTIEQSGKYNFIK